MSAENKKEPDKEKKPRFDQAQYDMLIRCSDEEKKKITVSEKGLRINEWQYKLIKVCATDDDGIKEWNTWRKENPTEEIHLEGANLRNAYLEGANLRNAYLEGARLYKAHLKGANLFRAHLEGAKLMKAHLKNAKLFYARLGGANFTFAHLEGSDFKYTYVNSNTELVGCHIDRKTDFRGVSLDTVRILQGTKQLLEYNGRRANWLLWYEAHHILKWLVKPFWWMSDYGLSTLRIIFTFSVLAVAFAGVYWLCPNCIMVDSRVGDLQGLWHAVYFSVVTMTTLGFGDIAANPDSWWGQTLLMLQVLLGYVLLAALVTRFAVLFTAGGPAGRFSKQPKKPTETPTKEPPN